MDRIKKLLFGLDFEYLELMSAVSGIGWGLSLILVPDMFEVFPNSYAGFMVLGGQVFWASITGLVGIAQLISVYVNRNRNLLIRRLLTLGAVFLWTTITFLFILFVDQISTRVIVDAVIAVGNALAYVRLSMRHRRVNAGIL